MIVRQALFNKYVFFLSTIFSFYQFSVLKTFDRKQKFKFPEFVRINRAMSTFEHHFSENASITLGCDFVSIYLNKCAYVWQTSHTTLHAIHNSTLQYIHCITLYYTKLHNIYCITLYYTTLHYIHCITLYYTTLLTTPLHHIARHTA